MEEINKKQQKGFNSSLSINRIDLRQEDNIDHNSPKLTNIQKNNQIRLQNNYSIFRFVDNIDIALIIIGTISGLTLGALLSLLILLIGQILNAFTQPTLEAMYNHALRTFFYFIYVGHALLVIDTVTLFVWTVTSQRQASKCRSQYLKSLLKQQIGWYETQNQSQLINKFSNDCASFQQSLQKIPYGILIIASIISRIIVALYKGYILALVNLSVVPLVILATYFYAYVLKSKGQKFHQYYLQAGGKAFEAIEQIKTVKMLNGQSYQTARYEESLDKAMKSNYIYAFLSGISMGALYLAIIGSITLGLWYGSVLVSQGRYNPFGINNMYSIGDVVTIVLSLVIGIFFTTKFAPAFEKIVEGKKAAQRIYQIIDRVPIIVDKNGLIPSNFKGIIQFENVSFAYPKQKSKIIYQKLNLKINLKKNAIVGDSGCGKSTILQLIMRLYEPDSGSIYLDGINLKDINLEWLRKNIGYVGQEPILFEGTIKQNILLQNQQFSESQIIEALKQASVYEFVQSLQKGINTSIKHGGKSLSGGQKQRIAIARALLKKPKILLLDQATSALDAHNQKNIQKNLDWLGQSIISITVAHRQSTIVNSQMIFVIENKKVSEFGKYSQLRRYALKNIKNIDLEMIMKKQSIQRINEENEIKAEKQEIQENQENKQSNQTVEKYNIFQIICKLLKQSLDQIPLYIIGLLSSIGTGFIIPIFTIYFSQIIASLAGQQRSNQNINDASSKAIKIACIGIALCIGKLLQFSLLSAIGQKITKKTRVKIYNKILKMPIFWFNDKNKETIALQLELDSRNINGLTTQTIGIVLEGVTGLIFSLFISFTKEWRMALTMLFVTPILMSISILQMKVQANSMNRTAEGYNQSNNIIIETISAIKTVYSSNAQKWLIKKYQQKLAPVTNLCYKKGLISGGMFGIGQLIAYISTGTLFFIGVVVIRDNPGVDVSQVLTAIFVIWISNLNIGYSLAMIPDAGLAKKSANKLFEIEDSVDQDQLQIQQESKLLKDNIFGDIEFDNVDFMYQQSNEKLLRQISFKIEKGKHVGFVGSSGCGKSTLFQLLLRFYSPTHGTIRINKENIKDFDIHYLRQSFATVFQEPSLFSVGVYENIKYNSNANEQLIKNVIKNVKVTQIVSNFKSFSSIQNLDQRIDESDRNVGFKGSQISGGQKQRIAIARTMVRQSPFLFLDQATSALDSETQLKIQKQMQLQMKDKTMITVAHKLEILQNCDQIFAFDKGKIIEKGSFKQLMEKKGFFYNFKKGNLQKRKEKQEYQQNED